MKKIIAILFAITLISCKQEAKKISKSKVVEKKSVSKILEEKPEKEIQFSEKELLAFMDSVAKLPQKQLMDKSGRTADSIFKNNKKDINKQLSALQFKQLKDAIKSTRIDIKTAENIFGKFPVDTLVLREGKVGLVLFSFDKNETDYNEFAVCLGYPADMSDNDLYFFKGNKLLSRITLHFRYELEIEHYKDNKDKTIIYYKENYASGTGIWWYNYYFYQYDGARLIPILNEVQESNLQSLGFRTRWLQTEIVKTKPLTIKMVYYQYLFDTISLEKKPTIANDSTFVKYNWDEKTKSLLGDYAHSKINKAEILSYCLERDSELLFINTYYEKLKKELLNPVGKRCVLYYLNLVKNEYSGL